MLGNLRYSYLEFESLQELKLTLPFELFKTLDEFRDKHELFLPQILHENQNQGDYDFDWISATFHGIFCYNKSSFCVEQRKKNKALFLINWGHELLEILFYKYNELGPLNYLIKITPTLVDMYDNSRTKILHRYKVNPDGSLGQKTT